MKQRKLVRKLYKACFTHDADKIKELCNKEFTKTTYYLYIAINKHDT